MPDCTQVHAMIPRALKQRAFSALALQEQKFSHWVQEHLEAWLLEVEQEHEGMARVESHLERVCRSK
ncbi:MAG TPA: hypothetical protein VIH59_37245 [Candidatus Tectomicrobia bacterium]|jgi:hypothetical protein